MSGFHKRVVPLLVAVLLGVSYPVALPGELSISTPAQADASPRGGPTAVASPAVAAGIATAVPTTTSTPSSASAALAKLRPKPAAAVAKPAVELPRRLRIPAIGVDAGFEFVGLAPDGAMDVPKNPQDVAWYQLGPRPGEPGNAVVAGHVDWGGKTVVFWSLKDLKAGEVVEVVAADDKSYEFVVQESWWYEAAAAPVQEVFRQTDATEITLITCGGVFDSKTRQYLSRLVVRGIFR